MKSLNTKITTNQTKVTNLDKKVLDLEEHAKQITSNMLIESDARKRYEKDSLKSISDNRTKIEEIVQSIQLMQREFQMSIDEIKREMSLSTDDKSKKIEQTLNEKMKQFNYYDQILSNNKFQNAAFENNIKKNIDSLENELKNSIKNFKDELNLNTVKINSLETQLNDNYKIIKEEVEGINKEIISLKNEIISLKNYQDVSTKEFKEIHGNILKQEEGVNNFINKTKLNLNEYESSLQKFKIGYGTQINELKDIQNEIYRNVDLINNKVNGKIKEVNDITFKQYKAQCIELEGFKKYITDEQIKFINFVEGKYDNLNNNLDKMFQYMNQDIDGLKRKNDSLENALNNNRNLFNNNFNELGEFFAKKYDDLTNKINNANNNNI